MPGLPPDPLTPPDLFLLMNEETLRTPLGLSAAQLESARDLDGALRQQLDRLRDLEGQWEAATTFDQRRAVLAELARGRQQVRRAADDGLRELLTDDQFRRLQELKSPSSAVPLENAAADGAKPTSDSPHPRTLRPTTEAPAYGEAGRAAASADRVVASFEPLPREPFEDSAQARAESGAGTEFRAFQLRHLPAIDAERIVRRHLQEAPLTATANVSGFDSTHHEESGEESGSAAAGTMSVKLIADRQTNRLLARGTREQLRRIEDILVVIDGKPGGLLGDRRVGSADASAASPDIRQSIPSENSVRPDR